MKKTFGMKRRRWNLGHPSRLDRSIFYFFHCAILCCMEKALLLSGGMDSTTLLWWMRARGDACAERIASFRDNGVCDPLEYEVDIAW